MNTEATHDAGHLMVVPPFLGANFPGQAKTIPVTLRKRDVSQATSQGLPPFPVSEGTFFALRQGAPSGQPRMRALTQYSTLRHLVTAAYHTG